MDILCNNPYRILGVFANSPIRERVVNVTKFKAYLKVGKSIGDCPLDLPNLLLPIERTEELIINAESQITLPKNQLEYALFWFIKGSNIDDVAINYLQTSNVKNAIEIWSKKNDIYSLQNRIICSIIDQDIKGVIKNAEILYGNYIKEFTTAILGKDYNINEDEVLDLFLNKLITIYNVAELEKHVTINNWKQKLNDKIVFSFIDVIEDALDSIKNAKNKGNTIYYEAGENLMNIAKEFLPKLQNILSSIDTRYKILSNMVSTELLQCAIEYFNKTRNKNTIERVYFLLKTANHFANNQSLKNKCQDNLKIISVYREKEKKEKEKEKLNRNINNCKNLDELIELYNTYKEQLQIKDKCSLKAFDLCKTKKDYETTLLIFDKYSSGGSKAISELEKINSAELKIALKQCDNLDEIINFYKKSNCQNLIKEEFSEKAFDLCKGKKDYELVIATFGQYCNGGRCASEKLEKINKIRSVIAKCILAIFVICLIGLFFGVKSYVYILYAIGYISGAIALGGLKSFEWEGLLIFLVAGGICAGSIFGAIELDDYLEYRSTQEANKRNELALKKLTEEAKIAYEKLGKKPSEDDCKAFVYNYRRTPYYDSVMTKYLVIVEKKGINDL